MAMLHAGLDLSRHRLDVHLLDAQGSTVQVATAPPDADGCAVHPQSAYLLEPWVIPG
jgi:hypothetical protein